MKNLTKKYKPTLFNKMCDILSNFYDTNKLEHMCALESQISGNYNTDEQLEWLERFSEVWEKVENREMGRN
tara:strand:+ start:171 stop:383 length:213 start_codon:yes stop_codon:yes gene_type:complete